MWVTIIADASYCPDTGMAGYGFWISSQRGKRGGDGIINAYVENNIAAEMMALLNGLYVASREGLIHPSDGVLLQTDCQAAIDAFSELRQNITQQERNLVGWFRGHCKLHNLKIRWKHVKGHTKNNDARSVVNNICDRKARRNMRRARAKFKINEIRGFLDDKRTARDS